MKGYETVWVPGSDHAGIATQVSTNDVTKPYVQGLQPDKELFTLVLRLEAQYNFF